VRAFYEDEALDWLNAAREAWAKLPDTAPPQARPEIAQTFQR
jgi:hypothetical protein